MKAEENEDDMSESNKSLDKETLMGEGMTLLRQSPRIKSRVAAEAAAMPIEDLIIGTTMDHEGKRRSMHLQQQESGGVLVDEDEDTNSEQVQNGNEITCIGAGLGGGFSIQLSSWSRNIIKSCMGPKIKSGQKR